MTATVNTWQRERFMDGPQGCDYRLPLADGRLLIVSRDYSLGGNFWQVTGAGIAHRDRRAFNGLTLAKRNAEAYAATGQWITDQYGRDLAR